MHSILFEVYPTAMLAAEAISQGRQARRENNLSLARAYYAEAAKAYHDQNDSLAYAHTIRHIADMHLDESNLVEAKPLYEKSLEIYRSSLNTKLLDLANAIRPYALLHQESGNIGTAKDLWQEARNLYSSLRLEEGVRECDAHLTQLQSQTPSVSVIPQ
jgi:tetratricopeptide (TPR) repeat protein